MKVLMIKMQLAQRLKTHKTWQEYVLKHQQAFWEQIRVLLLIYIYIYILLSILYEMYSTLVYVYPFQLPWTAETRVTFLACS